MNLKHWLFLLPLFVFLNFIKISDYNPERFFLKGRLINLDTNLPIKKLKVIIKDDWEDSFQTNDNGFEDNFITNYKGEFSCYATIDISKPEFWFRTLEFAQVGINGYKIDTNNIIDTIDIGTMYLVPYDNELLLESYNMPNLLKDKKKEKYNKLAISKIDSILEFRNCDLIMDTVSSRNLITRYQFRKPLARGTIIKKYKILKFKKYLIDK